MERDLGDILDRHSIAKLKTERIGSAESKREYEAFEEYITGRLGRAYGFDYMLFADLLLKLNGFIWDMESALKSGKDNLPVPHYLFSVANAAELAQIGITAIIIRNINSIRIDVKNIVNTFAQEGFRDVKKDHLSA